MKPFGRGLSSSKKIRLLYMLRFKIAAQPWFLVAIFRTLHDMTTWQEVVARNPQHSENYARRWKNIASSGRDIFGEARLVDAMVPRGATILDAGCGTGRVGGYLQHQGHQVLGVDIDETLLSYAREDYPEAQWRQGDLCLTPLPSSTFDLVVSAGNVMTFLDPELRDQALNNIAQSLVPSGRFVAGFGAGRGWSFEDFLRSATDAGMTVNSLHSTWDLRPFDAATSAFLVAILSRA